MTLGKLLIDYDDKSLVFVFIPRTDQQEGPGCEEQTSRMSGYCRLKFPLAQGGISSYNKIASGVAERDSVLTVS